MTAVTTALTILAALALVAWIYLLAFHGRFWRADQRLPRDLPAPAPAPWPSVVAVVPARNEAGVIGEAVASLLGQDYPGDFRVVLVDDHSDDGTADAARAAAAKSDRAGALTIVPARPLQAGWTGKLNAMASGVEAARSVAAQARYILFTDADIAHGADNLRRLVAKAEGEDRHLVSLMVALHCGSWAERLLIPAFVFFFQKLYPVPRVNDPTSRVAAAAGGCMLVRRDTLAAAGGLAAIKGALIDDCALARIIKAAGKETRAIWLGLADSERHGTRSIRPYTGLRGIWDMVARSAYTQLDHSPLLLLGTVAGMAVLYLASPLAFLWGLVTVTPLPALLGFLGYALMLAAYWPTARLYRSVGLGFALLPAAALLYTLMTVDSALRHARGRGGGWKGRTYARSGRGATAER
jgi:hopene-associated glycosyltransferase HpnB